MKISGYMCEVEWDGQTLRARGTNKASHFALMGENEVDVTEHVHEGQTAGEMIGGLRAARREAKAADELVLDRDEFTVEKFKTANPFINGNLTLRTTTGKRYQLHFRRKHNTDFTALAEALDRKA